MSHSESYNPPLVYADYAEYDDISDKNHQKEPTLTAVPVKYTSDDPLEPEIHFIPSDGEEETDDYNEEFKSDKSCNRKNNRYQRRRMGGRGRRRRPKRMVVVAGAGAGAAAGAIVAGPGLAVIGAFAGATAARHYSRKRECADNKPVSQKEEAIAGKVLS